MGGTVIAGNFPEGSIFRKFFDNAIAGLVEEAEACEKVIINDPVLVSELLSMIRSRNLNGFLKWRKNFLESKGERYKILLLSEI